MSSTGDRKRGRSESPEFWGESLDREVGSGDTLASALETVEDKEQAVQDTATEAVEGGQGSPVAKHARESSEAEAARELLVADVDEGLQESGATHEIGEMIRSEGARKVEEVGKPEEAGEAREAGEFGVTAQVGDSGETGKAGMSGEIGEVAWAGQHRETGQIGETIQASDIGEIGATEEIEDTEEYSDISDIPEVETVSECEDAEIAQSFSVVGTGTTAGEPEGNLHEMGGSKFIMTESQSPGGVSSGGGSSGGSVDSNREDLDVQPAVEEEQPGVLENMEEANRLPIRYLRFMFFDLVRLLMHCLNRNHEMLLHVHRGLNSMRSRYPRHQRQYPRSFLIEPGRVLVPYGEASAYHRARRLDANFLTRQNMAAASWMEDVTREPEHEDHTSSQETTYQIENSDQEDTEAEIEEHDEHDEVEEAKMEKADEDKDEEEEKENQEAQQEKFNQEENKS